MTAMAMMTRTPRRRTDSPKIAPADKSDAKFDIELEPASIWPPVGVSVVIGVGEGVMSAVSETIAFAATEVKTLPLGAVTTIGLAVIFAASATAV